LRNAIVIFNLVVASRHALVASSKPEVQSTLRAVGEVMEERVTEPAKCVVTGLLEPDRRKSGLRTTSPSRRCPSLLTYALALGDLVRLRGILGWRVVSEFFGPDIVFAHVQGTEQVCHRGDHS